MYYLLNESKDWADEFDVSFGEIFTENEYQQYKYLQDTLGSWYTGYYFGSNEGWDDDFDLLDFSLEPVTDEEYKVLKKFGLPGTRTITDMIYDELDDIFMEIVEDDEIKITDTGRKEFKVEIKDWPIEKFKKYVDMAIEQNLLGDLDEEDCED